jgi:hypothetical protein
MEQSKQPKKATPEQNANVAEQVKRIVVNQMIQEKLQSSENQLRIEMMAVYKQLTDNTNYTKDASKNVLDELVKLTDLVLLYKSRLEQVERDNKDLEGKLNLLAGQYKVHAERLNTYQIRIEQAERGGFFGEQRKDLTAIDRKLDILNRASKGHAERLNKLEKLK